MSSLEALFVRVEGYAFHSVVDQLAGAAKSRTELRTLERAEFSPPHPWLRLPVPVGDIPELGRQVSEGLGCVVIGLALQTVVDAFGFWRFDSGRPSRILVYGMAGGAEREWSRMEESPEPWESRRITENLDAGRVVSAIFDFYDLPRFSDHKLRIGPSWPFRRFEVFW